MKRIAVVVLLVAVLLVGCASPMRTVTYKITDVADVMLTWRNAQGGTEQATTRAPWSREFSMKPGTFAYISAQNMTGGNLTVAILVDGQVWKSSSANGKFTIATASGTIR